MGSLRIRARWTAVLFGVIVVVGMGRRIVVDAQDERRRLSTADLERAEQLFLKTCVSCHGDEGDAVAGVNIASGPFRRAYTDPDLVRILRNGIPGTAMPPQKLSEEQMTLVVGYLRWLMESPAQTAQSPER